MVKGVSPSSDFLLIQEQFYQKLKNQIKICLQRTNSRFRICIKGSKKGCATHAYTFIFASLKSLKLDTCRI
jgi:hypothetical protein